MELQKAYNSSIHKEFTPEMLMEHSKICTKLSPVTDDSAGEVLCSSCGVVIKSKTSDDSVADRVVYGAEDKQNQSNGPGVSLTIYDKGLSTKIGNNIDGRGKKISQKNIAEFRRLRMWDQRSKPKKMTSMSKTLILLNSMQSRLGIPDAVTENTAYLYRKAVAAKLNRGRTTQSLMLSCLYVACRQSGVARSLDDIAREGNIAKKRLSRDIRVLVRRLELSLDQYDTSLFVTKIANDLRLKEKTKRDALDIMAKCKEAYITSGKNPLSQAGACLYLSCLLNGEKITQKKFADIANVTDVTIRNRVKVIRETLGL